MLIQISHLFGHGNGLSSHVHTYKSLHNTIDRSFKGRNALTGPAAQPNQENTRETSLFDEGFIYFIHCNISTRSVAS